MSAYLYLLATLSFGIDAGWQPAPEGGVEYTLQLDEHAIATLKSGQTLFSDVMPDLRDVRKIRIVAGTNTLARLDPPRKSETLVAKPPIPETPGTEPGQETKHSTAYRAPDETTKADGLLNWAPSITEPALLASLGGNLFLGLVVVGAYRLNRRLTSRRESIEL